MDKFLFPILMTIIILFCAYAFKPSSDLTFTDELYFQNLSICKKYETEGKLNIIGNTFSQSKILGYKNNKCILQTVNYFWVYNSTLATNCSLDNTQLKELYDARLKPTMNFSGFTDRSIMNRFKKEGLCNSYKLDKGYWRQTR